ncbi:flagellar L-ring protein precursor FlgH [Comamonas sp. BIGb0124]|uniref:flagellar basal body L-ring protein FlgH n=1 Tax=Comamonas sp. BIGb0124 TaxID=2485130 RepID=UPI000F4AA078|nr:flagellar basal body L-ring protein FlgH [Comamonas sp. BIGb0124]ROR25046.1 flagellar L-ring protein precursor FlgH [Comamonas sp. BIGb0124]
MSRPTPFSRLLCVLASLALAVLCVACASPKVDLYQPQPNAYGPGVQPGQPAPVMPAYATRANSGSLFNTHTFRPGFEDRRARLVGDTLTINMVERVSASQKQSSSVGKTGEVSSGITAFPFLKGSTLGRLDAGASSSNTFSGKGGTESANTFASAMSATVVEVLPNGNMIVVGERQIGVNENVDVLRFSGTIDPRTIQPGNLVNSTQVANVRIESKAQGQAGEAQAIGWLARFFLTALPF